MPYAESPSTWIDPGDGVVAGQHDRAGGGVPGALAGGLRDDRVGDQPGVGFGGDVGLEPVVFTGPGLVGVPGFGVHGGDDPVPGDPLRDPPPPTTSTVVDPFDVLTGQHANNANA